jgi:hypothetical protein
MNVIDPTFEYTDQHHAHYEEHGYCIVGKLLSDEGLKTFRHEVDAIIHEKKQPDLPSDRII